MGVITKMNVEHRTSNIEHRIMMLLRSAIQFHLFIISVSFQPLDSAQGCESVENPELVNNPEPGRRVEVVERPI